MVDASHREPRIEPAQPIREDALLTGALIAGYVLGVTEAFGAVLLSPGYQQATTFTLLLAILLVRPQGLFGRPEARAV